jgi:hypothetical protein
MALSDDITSTGIVGTGHKVSIAAVLQPHISLQFVVMSPTILRLWLGHGLKHRAVLASRHDADRVGLSKNWQALCQSI